MKTPIPSPTQAPRSPLFFNLRVLCAAALLAALSIVLGKYLAISTPIFRFSLENLPILMAGIFFGPVVGGIVGAVADIIGCIMVGYTINPLVTLGGALVGILSGTVARIATRKGRPLKPLSIILSVALAHIVGSMTVKSIGLAIYYGTPMETILWRIPLYVVIGALESLVIILLSRSRVLMGELARLIAPRSRKARTSRHASPIRTYEEALAFIHSTSWKGSRPGLERTIELCRRIGDPQKRLRFIHIAGTNGKGSTSAMLAAALRAAGYRVGLYTSPFILRFNERMQIDGVDIPDEELAAVTEAVRPHAMAMKDTPTEFELITAIALLYFARHECDYVVLEVGMGGRLDSTNIIGAEEVVASVITGIALDHTAYLGDTHEAIAGEKAGIIKPGVPVIFGGLHPDIGEQSIPAHATACAAVIRERAIAEGSPYTAVNHRRLTVEESDIFGCTVTFGDWQGLHIPLAGLYQPYNAATALTTLEVLRTGGLAISEEAIREGLSAVRWPARFEILSREPLVIADGGHNPEGITAAVESVKHYFGHQKILLLTGVMADKDYDFMIARMGQIAIKAFCVRPANDRALDPHAYAIAFEKAGIPAEGYDCVAAGVTAAMAVARERGIPLLCLGSLYMYGEVRAAVESQI